MTRLFLTIITLALLAGCQGQRPIDLDALAGKARGGDPRAAGELVRLLGVAENDLHDRAYRIVIEIGEPMVGPLRDQVDTGNPDQRERSIAALGTLKVVAAVPDIVEVLLDRSLSRRYVAAWALGEIGDPTAIPVLLEVLDDADEQVVRYATRSLIKFNRAAVAPLIDVLDSGRPQKAAAAVRALGDIGDRRALEPLLQQVDSPARHEVFLALGKLRDPRAETALVEGLADDDWQVRMNAAMALGPVGSGRSVEPLETTLEDDVMVVREWSARSLSMITGNTVRYRDASGTYVEPYNVYH